MAGIFSTGSFESTILSPFQVPPRSQGDEREAGDSSFAGELTGPESGGPRSPGAIDGDNLYAGASRPRELTKRGGIGEAIKGRKDSGQGTIAVRHDSQNKLSSVLKRVPSYLRPTKSAALRVAAPVRPGDKPRRQQPRTTERGFSSPINVGADSQTDGGVKGRTERKPTSPAPQSTGIPTLPVKPGSKRVLDVSIPSDPSPPITSVKGTQRLPVPGASRAPVAPFRRHAAVNVSRAARVQARTNMKGGSELRLPREASGAALDAARQLAMRAVSNSHGSRGPYESGQRSGDTQKQQPAAVRFKQGKVARRTASELSAISSNKQSLGKPLVRTHSLKRAASHRHGALRLAIASAEVASDTATPTLSRQSSLSRIEEAARKAKTVLAEAASVSSSLSPNKYQGLDPATQRRLIAFLTAHVQKDTGGKPVRGRVRLASDVTFVVDAREVTVSDRPWLPKAVAAWDMASSVTSLKIVGVELTHLGRFVASFKRAQVLELAPGPRPKKSPLEPDEHDEGTWSRRVDPSDVPRPSRASDMVTFFHALKDLRGLRELRVTNFAKVLQLDAAMTAFSELASANADSLEEINISHNGLKSSSLVTLGHALSHFPLTAPLARVVVNRNGKKSARVTLLADLFHRYLRQPGKSSWVARRSSMDDSMREHVSWSTHTELWLQGIDCSTDNEEASLAVLALLPRLTALHMTSCNLEHLERALPNELALATSLSVLDLRGNNLTDVGAKQLARALENNGSLTTVDVRDNAGITNKGYDALCSSLSLPARSSPLQDVFASDETVSAVVRLRKRFWADNIDLHADSEADAIQPAEFPAFVRLLRISVDATSIDLSGNALTAPMVAELCDALLANRDVSIVENVDLCNTGLTDKSAQVLRRLLDEHPSLNTLQIGENPLLTREGAMAIMGAREAIRGDVRGRRAVQAVGKILAGTEDHRRGDAASVPHNSAEHSSGAAQSSVAGAPINMSATTAKDSPVRTQIEASNIVATAAEHLLASVKSGHADSAGSGWSQQAAHMQQGVLGGFGIRQASGYFESDMMGVEAAIDIGQAVSGALSTEEMRFHGKKMPAIKCHEVCEEQLLFDVGGIIRASFGATLVVFTGVGRKEQTTRGLKAASSGVHGSLKAFRKLRKTVKKTRDGKPKSHRRQGLTGSVKMSMASVVDDSIEELPKLPGAWAIIGKVCRIMCELDRCTFEKTGCRPSKLRLPLPFPVDSDTVEAVAVVHFPGFIEGGTFSKRHPVSAYYWSHISQESFTVHSHHVDVDVTSIGYYALAWDSTLGPQAMQTKCHFAVFTPLGGWGKASADGDIPTLMWAIPHTRNQVLWNKAIAVLKDKMLNAKHPMTVAAATSEPVVAYVGSTASLTIGIKKAEFVVAADSLVCTGHLEVRRLQASQHYQHEIANIQVGRPPASVESPLRYSVGPRDFHLPVTIRLSDRLPKPPSMFAVCDRDRFSTTFHVSIRSDFLHEHGPERPYLYGAPITPEEYSRGGEQLEDQIARYEDRFRRVPFVARRVPGKLVMELVVDNIFYSAFFRVTMGNQFGESSHSHPELVHPSIQSITQRLNKNSRIDFDKEEDRLIELEETHGAGAGSKRDAQMFTSRTSGRVSRIYDKGAVDVLLEDGSTLASVHVSSLFVAAGKSRDSHGRELVKWIRCELPEDGTCPLAMQQHVQTVHWTSRPTKVLRSRKDGFVDLVDADGREFRNVAMGVVERADGEEAPMQSGTHVRMRQGVQSQFKTDSSTDSSDSDTSHGTHPGNTATDAVDTRTRRRKPRQNRSKTIKLSDLDEHASADVLLTAMHAEQAALYAKVRGGKSSLSKPQWFAKRWNQRRHPLDRFSKRAQALRLARAQAERRVRNFAAEGPLNLSAVWGRRWAASSEHVWGWYIRHFRERRGSRRERATADDDSSEWSTQKIPVHRLPWEHGRPDLPYTPATATRASSSSSRATDSYWAVREWTPRLPSRRTLDRRLPSPRGVPQFSFGNMYFQTVLPTRRLEVSGGSTQALMAEEGKGTVHVIEERAKSPRVRSPRNTSGTGKKPSSVQARSQRGRLCRVCAQLSTAESSECSWCGLAFIAPPTPITTSGRSSRNTLAMMSGEDASETFVTQSSLLLQSNAEMEREHASTPQQRTRLDVVHEDTSEGPTNRQDPGSGARVEDARDEHQDTMTHTEKVEKRMLVSTWRAHHTAGKRRRNEEVLVRKPRPRQPLIPKPPQATDARRGKNRGKKRRAKRGRMSKAEKAAARRQQRLIASSLLMRSETMIPSSKDASGDIKQEEPLDTPAGNDGRLRARTTERSVGKETRRKHRVRRPSQGQGASAMMHPRHHHVAEATTGHARQPRIDGHSPRRTPRTRSRGLRSGKRATRSRQSGRSRPDSTRSRRTASRQSAVEDVALPPQADPFFAFGAQVIESVSDRQQRYHVTSLVRASRHSAAEEKRQQLAHAKREMVSSTFDDDEGLEGLDADAIAVIAGVRQNIAEPPTVVASVTAAEAASDAVDTVSSSPESSISSASEVEEQVLEAAAEFSAEAPPAHKFGRFPCPVAIASRDHLEAILGCVGAVGRAARILNISSERTKADLVAAVVAAVSLAVEDIAEDEFTASSLRAFLAAAGISHDGVEKGTAVEIIELLQLVQQPCADASAMINQHERSSAQERVAGLSVAVETGGDETAHHSAVGEPAASLSSVGSHASRSKRSGASTGIRSSRGPTSAASSFRTYSSIQNRRSARSSHAMDPGSATQSADHSSWGGKPASSHSVSRTANRRGSISRRGSMVSTSSSRNGSRPGSSMSSATMRSATSVKLKGTGSAENNNVADDMIESFPVQLEVAIDWNEEHSVPDTEDYREIELTEGVRFHDLEFGMVHFSEETAENAPQPVREAENRRLMAMFLVTLTNGEEECKAIVGCRAPAALPSLQVKEPELARRAPVFGFVVRASKAVTRVAHSAMVHRSNCVELARFFSTCLDAFSAGIQEHYELALDLVIQLFRLSVGLHRFLSQFSSKGWMLYVAAHHEEVVRLFYAYDAEIVNTFHFNPFPALQSVCDNMNLPRLYINEFMDPRSFADVMLGHLVQIGLGAGGDQRVVSTLRAILDIDRVHDASVTEELRLLHTKYARAQRAGRRASLSRRPGQGMLLGAL